MWIVIMIVIFLGKIFALVTTPSATKTQSNKTISYPNGSLLGDEMWLMGITVKKSEAEVSHHCLGINIWHTGMTLTTCSCLATEDQRQPIPYNASLGSAFWNPAYLGWGENPVKGKSFELSLRCKPMMTPPLPWLSDLAILDTREFVEPIEYARVLDVDLPPAQCIEKDESLFERTFSSWSPKICSEELFWTTKQAQWRGESCKTYITEGEYDKLVLKEVQIVMWHDCERLVCDMYPTLCDISFELTGILCTTRPPSNSCLPLGSPLICDQAVLGLYSRSQGSKSTCNETFPYLMYTSLVRVSSDYHNLLSPKDKKRICECYKHCVLSDCTVVLPRSIIISAILTILMQY